MLFYEFLGKALPLAGTWVIIIALLRLVERVLSHRIKTHRNKRKTVSNLKSEETLRRERIERLTRAALLSGVSKVDEEVMNNIRILAKSRRMSGHELERLAKDKFGTALAELDNEDAEALAETLEAMKPK